MKIASIQLNICWQDKAKNLAQAQHYIQKASEDACDLVIFPEMFNSGFSMNADKIAEERGTETTLFLSNLAQKFQINLIAGFVEKSSTGYENMAIFINSKGNVKARYVKNYPYSHSGEHKVYERGDKQVIFDISGHKASLFICYDLRFPELFRKVANQSEIIIVIASWPEARQDHWQTLLKARAIENQCFVIGVNRIGNDGNGLEYIGGSQCYSPTGKRLSHGKKRLVYITSQINPSEVGMIRKKLPFLKDMIAPG